MQNKTVILVDFDNIFSSIWSLDRDLAINFASNPSVWLDSLSDRYLITESRRWLVARCYLNPAGRVFDGNESSEKIFFSRFRPFWVSAGFEVVDTPQVAKNKNAADIRIVIDAIDLVQHLTRFDEFVIASGDSDFTPLLQRLRANDRLITVMSPGNASKAYTTLADRIIDMDAISALFHNEEPNQISAQDVDTKIEVSNELNQAFSSFILSQYTESTSPINLASLAQLAARSVPGARESRWLGTGSFTAAIDKLGLPNAAFKDNFLWDDERHQEPVDGGSFLASELPEAVEILTRTVDLPRLAKDAWPAVFMKLAEYARSHDFNLTEATKWTRDSLACEGVNVGRAALGYVVRGAQFGGAPLNKEPPPDADGIANAFLSNLINQAYSAGMALDKEDEETIANWLGLADPE